MLLSAVVTMTVLSAAMSPYMIDCEDPGSTIRVIAPPGESVTVPVVLLFVEPSLPVEDIVNVPSWLIVRVSLSHEYIDKEFPCHVPARSSGK